jgi:hypothetical protein
LNRGNSIRRISNSISKGNIFSLKTEDVAVIKNGSTISKVKLNLINDSNTIARMLVNQGR